MSLPVERPAKGNLHDPGFGSALVRVKKCRPLIHVEKRFLDDLLGFAIVAHDARGDAKHQAGISAEKNVQCLIILRLQIRNQFLIARRWHRRCFWKRNNRRLVSAPNQRQCKCASIRGRTHTIEPLRLIRRWQAPQLAIAAPYNSGRSFFQTKTITKAVAKICPELVQLRPSSRIYERSRIPIPRSMCTFLAWPKMPQF